MYSHLQERSTPIAKMLHIIHVQQNQIIIIIINFLNSLRQII